MLLLLPSPHLNTQSCSHLASFIEGCRLAPSSRIPLLRHRLGTVQCCLYLVGCPLSLRLPNPYTSRQVGLCLHLCPFPASSPSTLLFSATTMSISYTSAFETPGTHQKEIRLRSRLSLRHEIASRIESSTHFNCPIGNSRQPRWFPTNARFAVTSSRERLSR